MMSLSTVDGMEINIQRSGEVLWVPSLRWLQTHRHFVTDIHAHVHLCSCSRPTAHSTVCCVCVFD